MARLKGKIAIVTGASSGIGRGIALAMSREGANLILADLAADSNQPNLDDHPEESTLHVIDQAGGKAIFQACDVSDEAQFARLFAVALENFGGVDIMVNNAGVVRAGRRMHEMPVEDLDLCYRINVRGTWIGTTLAVRHFLDTKKAGSVINMVSTAGLIPIRDESPYAVSKAACAQLTRVAASEYAAFGIRVNGICPTFVRTPITAQFAESKAFMDWLPSFVPAGRMAEIPEVAALAVFLASDDAQFITGALIPIDGGETVARPDLPELGGE